jgi:hypothetical protein
VNPEAWRSRASARTAVGSRRTTEIEESDANFRSLTRSLKNKRVLVFCRRDITRLPHLWGEDFYMFTLTRRLRAADVSIDIGVPAGNSIIVHSEIGIHSTLELANIMEDYDTFLLNGMSPASLLVPKLRRRIELMMLVSFLWNRNCSLLENIRYLVGDTLWQVAVNAYIVASQGVAEGLRRRGIYRTIYFVAPTYSCGYCHMDDHVPKRESLQGTLPEKVRVVYIGKVLPKRFSVEQAVNHLCKDHGRKYELTVYTATPIRERTWNRGNVTVKIYNRLLTDEEKCKVLRSSHIFVAPTYGTTMDPAISIIEARYHGNIVLHLPAKSSIHSRTGQPQDERNHIATARSSF